MLKPGPLSSSEPALWQGRERRPVCMLSERCCPCRRIALISWKFAEGQGPERLPAFKLAKHC